jgi:Mrp family chromosome partitioning ATPase
VADPVLIAPHTSGVLVVLEAGRTSQAAVQRIIDNFSLAGARVLGVALNKVDPRAQEVYYGYGYGYDYQALGKGKDR